MPSALAQRTPVLTAAEEEGLARLTARGLLVSPATPEPVRLPVIPAMKGQARKLLDGE